MDKIITCFHCRHWLKGCGLRFDNPRHVGDGNWVHSIGTGHCEHPIRPRGLTTTDYSCRDAEPKTPMVDVTPQRPALSSGERAP